MSGPSTGVKGRGTDMTVGSPIRLIVNFSIPLLLGNLFQQLYNTVDSIIVGNFVGKHALAAVGTGFPFMFAMISLFLGFGIATTVLIAQAYGAKNLNRVNTIAGTSYRFLLITGIPFTIAGVLAAGPVLTAMNVPKDGTLEMATTYLVIIFAGILGTIGYNLNAGILQGLGDSKSSVRFLIIAAIINTILDLLFVIPLQMGVAGAALATIIAQFISWALGVRYINRHYHFLHIRLGSLPFDWAILKETIRLGVPSAIQNAVFSFGIMFLNSLINTFGTDFMAGFNGANKIDTLVFMPVQSFANAVTAYTGQNVGAGDLDRVKKGRRAGMIVAVGSSVAISLILYPFAGAAISLFNDAPGVIECGEWYLHTVLPFYPLLAILFVNNSVIRGVGRMTVPLVTSLVALWFARIPAAYWLAAHFGKQYIFYSYGFGWIIGVALALAYYYFGNWQKLVTERESLENAEESAPSETA